MAHPETITHPKNIGHPEDLAHPGIAGKTALLVDQTQLSTSPIPVPSVAVLTVDDSSGSDSVAPTDCNSTTEAVSRRQAERDSEVARIKACLAQCGDAGLRAHLAELRRKRVREAARKGRKPGATADMSDEEGFEARVARIRRIQVRVAELRGGDTAENRAERFKTTNSRLSWLG